MITWLGSTLSEEILLSFPKIWSLLVQKLLSTTRTVEFYWTEAIMFFAMAMKCVIPLGGDLLLWLSLAEDVLACSSFEFFILVVICWKQSSAFLVSRFSWALQVVKECDLVGKGLSDKLNEGCYRFFMW